MPRMRGAVIAVASLLLATLLTFPLAKFVIYSRDVLFVAAVMLASRYAGAAPGLIVSFASVLIFDWFFDSTPHLLDFSAGGVTRAIVFSALSVLITSMERHRRYAMERLAETNRTLRSALEEIKTLRGLLPICMYCKKIRTDEEVWIEIEDYVRKHSDAQFSHGICPICYQRHHPDLYTQRFGPKAT